MRWSDLLRRDDVTEELSLRSTVGVCAYHGGGLERATDIIAREAAAAAGASYYGVITPEDPSLHIPSAQVDPAESNAMTTFIEHVETVFTIHGYGRHDQLRTVMLGGRNRDLAEQLGDALGAYLGDEFTILADIEAIPSELRGLHASNPVNLPANSGVQVELPPGARWNREEWGWSDHDGIGRARQVDQVIAALVETIGTTT